MPSTYDDFRREPSRSHQCMHNYDDGRRCRAMSMHNNYMCFAHRDNVIPPVYENEPFEIPHLANRAAIQQALGDLAARLASNRMDLKRAGLLAYILQVASCNLASAALAAEPPLVESNPASSLPAVTAPEQDSSTTASSDKPSGSLEQIAGGFGGQGEVEGGAFWVGADQWKVPRLCQPEV
jgi:hypothetical protein